MSHSMWDDARNIEDVRDEADAAPRWRGCNGGNCLFCAPPDETVGCFGCRESCPEHGGDRARSTLQLLSRFAVFMWMEASYRTHKGKRGPRGRHRLRSEVVACALHDGLLRVDWGPP